MKKKDKIIFGIGIIAMTLAVLIGFTYAYWFINKKQVSENLVATSCLDISISNESVGIDNDLAYPMTDEEGLETTPYTFTLTNHCNIKTKVNMVLDIEKTSDFSLEHYKASLKGDIIEWDPILLSKAETELNPDTEKYHKIIANDIFEINDSKNYELRLWINEDVTLDDVLGEFKSKLRISMEPYRMCSMTITDSNPGEFNGNGTASDPYLIESIEDLVALSVGTNNKTLPNNVYYDLTTDLDFSCENSYVNYENTTFGDINENGMIEPLLTELTTGAGFNPIGDYDSSYYSDNSTPFNSNFNGNYHTISSLYSDRQPFDRSTAGLFGYVKQESGPQLVLKNLRIGVDKVSANVYIGILGGYLNARSNHGILVKNIETFGDIQLDLSGSSGSKYIGMIGDTYSTDIINCINKVNFNTTMPSNSYFGGIAGLINNYGNLKNCTNYGDINYYSNSGGKVGGIVGHQYMSEDSENSEHNYLTISNLNNYGDITATAGSIGGIFGQNDTNCLVLKKSNNYGNLNVTPSNRGAGGLIGNHDNGSAVDCYNYGNITGHLDENSYAGIGGLFGYVDNGLEKTFIYNVGNSGDEITVDGVSGGYVGGVIGYSPGGVNYSNMFNNANITVTSNNSSNTFKVGGILGTGYINSYTNLKPFNSYNVGNIEVNVTGKALVGGIYGYNYNLYANVINLGNIHVHANPSSSLVALCGAYEYSYYGTVTNFFSKGNLKTNVNTVGLANNVYNITLSNIYLDINSDETTPLIANFYLQKSGNTATREKLYYKITGKTGYTINEESEEYDFSQVNGMWFRDTLNLGDNWYYEDGYYPLLYKLDDNKNPTTELLPGQIKKAIE